MVVYSFFSRIVKVVGALNLSKLVCRIQANQTNERNTGTSVKQRKNIFQVRDTLCILSYCVLSQMSWNVFFQWDRRFSSAVKHDYRWSRFAENRLQIRDLRIEIRFLPIFHRISSTLH
jgi:hypothetical protein